MSSWSSEISGSETSGSRSGSISGDCGIALGTSKPELDICCVVVQPEPIKRRAKASTRTRAYGMRKILIDKMYECVSYLVIKFMYGVNSRRRPNPG